MKKTKLASILALSLIVSIFVSNNSYADEILNIAGFTELNKCYTAQGAPLKKDISDIKNGLSIDKMFSGDKDGKVAIPNNWQNTIADGNLSCEELIIGYDHSHSRQSNPLARKNGIQGRGWLRQYERR